MAIGDVLPKHLNALVKRIMRYTGQKDPNLAVQLLLTGEWLVTKPPREWYEKDGIVYLEVTSDGTSGPGWMKRLNRQGIGLHGNATTALLSEEFTATKGVTYKVAILRTRKDNAVFADIEWEASHLGFHKLPVEVACLLREKFWDWEVKAMGLSWIEVMHEPMGLMQNHLTRLALYASWDYENFIWVQPVHKDDAKFEPDYGFAYLVSQESS